MLKLFFHRNSWILRLVNLLAGIELLALVFAPSLGLQVRMGFVSGFLAFTWIFFNLLDWIPWYFPHRGKLGIRIHFQKNIVPVAYLCALGFACNLLGAPSWITVVLSVLMLPIYYVSLILLYFHWRDRSSLMPSYFSHNYYLQEKEPSWSRSPSSDSVLEN